MSTFHFKYFSIKQADTAMKVGTDAMLLGSFVDVSNKYRALDIGSGTGVLACMLAQQNPNLFIDAIEIEDKAFHELVYNTNKASFSDQINPIHEDVLVHNPNYQYDLIVSNPPYFEDTYLSEDKERNLARHVLDLTPVKLLNLCNQLLSDTGDFWVVLPVKYITEWLVNAAKMGFFFLTEIQIMGVPGRHVRSVIRFSKQINILDRRVFVIRDANGNYTNEYKVKTSEFHFKTPVR
jgi:tRNA1Val (adenine37-N6)-methyltransferase